MTNSLLPKARLSNTFCDFNFIMLANVFLGVGMSSSYAAVFPMKEGEIQVFAGLAPSNQTVGSLLRALGREKIAILKKIVKK